LLVTEKKCGLFICFCEWVFLRCKLHFPGLSKSIGFLKFGKIDVLTADHCPGIVDGQFTRPSSFPWSMDSEAQPYEHRLFPEAKQTLFNILLAV